MCRVFSGSILLSSIFTRSEWGFFRIMPYRAHLVIDFLVGVLALSSPWLFGFSDNALVCNTFLVFGTFGVLVGLLSQPEEMDSKRGGDVVLQPGQSPEALRRTIQEESL